MKQRIFEVVDRNGRLQHFIMAENIGEARYYEENPDLIVVDPQECKKNNEFSWQNYFILEICAGTAAANDYMAASWAHEVADQIEHNQFTNWKGVN